MGADAVGDSGLGSSELLLEQLASEAARPKAATAAADVRRMFTNRSPSGGAVEAGHHSCKGVGALQTAALLTAGSPALAAQERTTDAAMAAAQSQADCWGCEFGFSSKRPVESARRGLVSIHVGDPQGGGAVMIMAYTGSTWGVLWEGNGSTRNVESVPGRIAICMNQGGWTNIRNNPGVNYRWVGKMSSPTIKKVFGVRLSSQVGRVEGVAWYRISFKGTAGLGAEHANPELAAGLGG